MLIATNLDSARLRAQLFALAKAGGVTLELVAHGLLIADGGQLLRFLDLVTRDDRECVDEAVGDV